MSEDASNLRRHPRRKKFFSETEILQDLGKCRKLALDLGDSRVGVHIQ